MWRRAFLLGTVGLFRSSQYKAHRRSDPRRAAIEERLGGRTAVTEFS